jgi:hypothetical protein
MMPCNCHIYEHCAQCHPEFFGSETPATHYTPAEAMEKVLNVEIPSPVLKDSGSREEMPTGSRRDVRTGKGRYDLLPTRAMRRLARHFEAGASKYGDRNWEKGQPLSRYMDSALRHAFNYLEGQRDEDHLAAAIWNLVCLCETEERTNARLLPPNLADLPDPQREAVSNKYKALHETLLEKH